MSAAGTNYAVFGRKLLETAGWPPESIALVNLEGFGQACAEVMGTKRDMPDPNRYIVNPAPASRRWAEQVQAAAPETVTAGDPDLPIRPRTLRELRWLYEQGFIDQDEFRLWMGLPPRRRRWWHR